MDIIPPESYSRKRVSDSTLEKYGREEKVQRCKKLKENFELNIDPEKNKVASCKLCATKGTDKSIKMKNSNTSGLMRHLQNYHEEIYKDIYGANEASGPKKQKMNFDQKEFENKLIDWTSKKYLPYNFFEDEETESIFAYLNDKAKVPKRNKMRELSILRFEETQKVVLEILQQNTSKMSYTLDGWTSINGKSHYGITGHFIDEDWILRSLVIDFLPSNGNHTGNDIANLFLGVLQDYGLTEKLQGVTMDNAAANTSFMEKLSNLMNSLFGTQFDPNDLHFRCFAHIINLAAQDMLRDLEIDEAFEEEENDSDDEETSDEEENREEIITSNLKIMSRLRALFKKLKYSEQWREKLKSACDVMGVKMQSPILDVSTRWNSAFDMISAALKMRKALEFLCDNNAQLKPLGLTPSEWLLLENVAKYLKYFKTLSTELCGEKYITLPLVVVGFNLLLDKLECAVKKIDENRQRTACDNKLRNALQAARSKLLKHYQKCNWIYCALLILDPRHKFETFRMSEWGQEMASESLNKFETIYKELYFVSQSNTEPEHNEDEDDQVQDDDDLDTRCLFVQNFRSEWRDEIDRYLQAPRTDRNADVAQWWKQHQDIYPNLSRMARDFFSIQATSVPAERVFSKAGLIMRKHRNRLNNESARSSICLNSWMTCSLSSVIRDRLSRKSLDSS